MIILLQREINIVPGRQMPARPPEGVVGDNCAVLQIVNNTNQENEYTIRIDCAHQAWRSEWAHLASIVEMTTETGSYSQPSKPDMAMSDGSLRVFVARQSQRKVMIAFDIPRAPDSRAGRYLLKVQVRTRITAGATPQPQLEELAIDAFIEPYYDWGLTVNPGRRGVGLLRRSAGFQVQVINRGNDWLYCQLRPPAAQQQANMQVSLLSEAIAVPPPEPEQAESCRRIPLIARTQLKKILGGEVASPLNLRAFRIDAPSIPQLPRQDYGSAVVERPDRVLATTTVEPPNITDETFQVGTLVYNPPIRSFITSAMEWIVKNIKAAIMAVMGLLVVFVIAGIIWQAFVQDMRIEPLIGTATESQRLVPFKGRYVAGAAVWVYTTSNSISQNSPIRLKADAGNGLEKKFNPHAVPATALSVINQLNVNNPQYLTVNLDEVWSNLQNGDKVKFRVVRGSPFARLLPKLLTYECQTVISIEKKKGEEPPSLDIDYLPPAKPKEAVTVTGSNLGHSGVVSINGSPVKVNQWDDGSVTFTVPDGMSPGKGNTVIIRPRGSKESLKAQVDIVDEMAATPPAATPPSATPPAATPPTATPPAAVPPTATPPTATPPTATPPIRRPLTRIPLTRAPLTRMPLLRGNDFITSLDAGYQALKGDDEGKANECFARATRSASGIDRDLVKVIIDLMKSGGDDDGVKKRAIIVCSKAKSGNATTQALGYLALGWVQDKNWLTSYQKADDQALKNFAAELVRDSGRNDLISQLK